MRATDRVDIGRTGLRVTRLGLGGVSLSGAPPSTDTLRITPEDEAVALIQRSLALGLIYLDTALTEQKERCRREGRPFARQDLHAAIMSGAVERVRPKMMTVAAIMAGLLPIMWSHGTGAEVMQRIAVPMIGGMVSSTLLTLIVSPVIYAVVKALPAREPVANQRRRVRAQKSSAAGIPDRANST